MSTNCALKRNNYIKPVEICTFAALYKMNNNAPDNSNITSIYKDVFKSQHADLNVNFRESGTTKYIYKYNIDNKKDLCFPLKNNDVDSNSPYAINCVIATGNPLYTYDKDKKACTLIPNIQSIPNLIKYSENKDYIYFDNNDEYNYEYKDIKAYCENKWSDWIIIPNYHFGNNYFKDTGNYSKNDVRKCYKPCNNNKLPYVDINGVHKCINKNNADNGVYSKKLDYSPFALINLLGNTKKTLKDLYIYMTLYEYYKFKDIPTSLYEVDTNKSLLNSSCRVTPCPYNNSTKEIDDTFSLFSDTIFANIININTFESIKNYKNYDNILTYKNVNFNEEDPELLTLRGLINFNILTYPILIHTFILSYNIHKFNENDIINIATYFNATKSQEIIPIADINENKYNVNSILTKILETNKNYKDKDDNIKVQYVQRLANILYKAINNCYNNKTEFSKNILIKTKEAFEHYIKSENNALFTDCYNLTQNASADLVTYATIPSAFKTLFTTTYLNSTKTGFEISYINANDIATKLAVITTNSIYIASTSSKTSINDFINNYTYYKEEILESNTNCKSNEIYDSVTKVCQKCGTYCTTDKCSTDNRCKYYCTNVCKETNTIEQKTTCGDIKKNKIENKVINNFNTPLGEDKIDIFNQLNNSLKSVLAFVFFLIILYIIYIFYEIFGEAILTFINFIIYYLRLIYSIIYHFVSNYNLLWTAVDYDMANYEKNFNNTRYNKVNNKMETIV